jgi:hypothetical protein
MARHSYPLARVAVLIREPGRWLWWLGLLGAAAGLGVPGVTGRRVGVAGGAAAFIVAAAAVLLARRKRYRSLVRGASRAALTVTLQDRRVTALTWRRAHRWWLLAAFAVSLGTTFAASSAAGLLLAGAGAGLLIKARWIGRWEREHDALLWIRPEWATKGPAAKDARGYQTTGPAAGDAAPGGGRKRVLAGQP